MMQYVSDNLLQLIGILTLGGATLGGIGYWFFKLLAGKWLEQKFAEKLEGFKHEKQKEIEELKFQISRLFDRATKLHQREYEVLPELWGKLVDAYHLTKDVTAAYQTFPDLDTMSKEMLDGFLAESPLREWQIKDILSSGNKTDVHFKHISNHKYNLTQESCREFYVYLLKNSIFIPSDLEQKFRQLDSTVHKALREWRSNQQNTGQPTTHTKRDELHNEGSKLIDELGQLVRARLGSS